MIEPILPSDVQESHRYKCSVNNREQMNDQLSCYETSYCSQTVKSPMVGIKGSEFEVTIHPNRMYRMYIVIAGKKIENIKHQRLFEQLKNHLHN